MQGNALEVSAKNAILIECESGDIIFSKNSSSKAPMASTTKIMTAIVAIENGELYIKRDVLNGVTDFVIENERTEDGITTVTVQFFADCNRFIKSDVVEYYIDEKECILGCERIVFSDYEPYGATNKFDEKS